MVTKTTHTHAKLWTDQDDSSRKQLVYALALYRLQLYTLSDTGTPRTRAFLQPVQEQPRSTY